MLDYRPHPLLKNGHLQTILLGLSPGDRPATETISIPIQLDDGEQMLAHEELGPPLASDAPLVILVHGLGGDHSAPYLERIAYQLRRRNRLVWRIDLRGSGKGFDLAWRPAHAGSSSDLLAVLCRARQLYPNSPIFLVGFSLSGNIVLKMLGELACGKHGISLEQANIVSALAITPPLDLTDCADNMDRWSRRIYSRYYVKILEQQAARKRDLFTQWESCPTFPPIRTIREFDERYTAPLSGFRDTRDYYSQASSIHWLPMIRTPTQILLDRHDPIVTWKSHLKAKYDPAWVKITLTRHGGHMGYFGMDDQNRMFRWLEYYVVQQASTLIF